MKALLALCVALFLGSCSMQDMSKTPIAIVVPVSHPSLQKIEDGFKETIEKEAPGKYRFVTFNAQGNKTLMRGEVETIASDDYALVFTIGTSASQMTAEVFEKRKVDTPIVFAAVDNPERVHLDGKHATGIRESVDFNGELDFVKAHQPDLKSLLVVYNPMEVGRSEDADLLQAIGKAKGIDVTPVEIFQSSEMKTRVLPYIHQADGVIVLRDNTVVSGLDPLIRLCNDAHIPLIASDLDSPDRGAAMGYGVYEEDFGIEGAGKALRILEEHVAPEEIPITALTQFSTKINPDAAIKQGVQIQ
ncbi:MAG: hypothetical protein RL235_718 [Chlamydiota bacterium]|jgi:putative ABC transport system substrate-binding protein